MRDKPTHLIPPGSVDAKRKKTMTQTNFTKEQKLAIVAAGKIFGSPYKDGDSVYFTVYGDRYKKYSLDEAVNSTINNPSSSKYVNFSVIRDGYTGENKLVAEFAPRVKFHVTKGEGWNPSFVTDDRRDAVNFLSGLSNPTGHSIIEIPQPNLFTASEAVESVKEVKEVVEKAANPIKEAIAFFALNGLDAVEYGPNKVKVQGEVFYCFKSEPEKWQQITNKVKSNPVQDSGRRRR